MEYKFRGKRVNNGEWVYGYYFKTPLTDEATGSKPEDGWYFLTGRERHCIAQNNAVYEVEPETVGQYTGLRDKNGKEIYEGDILSRKEWGMGSSHEDEERYEVQPLDCYLDEGEQFGHFRVHLWSTWCEVIGNIHDNPLEVTP